MRPFLILLTLGSFAAGAPAIALVSLVVLLILTVKK
jgi:hypothetical protein